MEPPKVAANAAVSKSSAASRPPSKSSPGTRSKSVPKPADPMEVDTKVKENAINSNTGGAHAMQPPILPTPVVDAEETGPKDSQKKRKRKREPNEVEQAEAPTPTEGVALRKIKSKKEAGDGGGRHDNSLNLLTKKFVDLFNQTADPIDGSLDLNEAARKLGVAKRRIYDITNVLEGIDMLEKTKNSVRWRGGPGAGIMTEDQKKKTLEARADMRKLEVEEEELDKKLEQMHRQIQMLLLEKNAYMTHDDILAIPEFRESTLLAIRAPPGTPVEVPLDDQGRPKKQILMRGTQPIEVYLVDSEQQHESSGEKSSSQQPLAALEDNMDVVDDDETALEAPVAQTALSPIKTPTRPLSRARAHGGPLSNTPKSHYTDEASMDDSVPPVPQFRSPVKSIRDLSPDDSATAFLHISSSPLASPIKMTTSIPSSPMMPLHHDLSTAGSSASPSSRRSSGVARALFPSDSAASRRSPRKPRAAHDDDDYYLRFIQGDEGVADFYADDSESLTLTNTSTMAPGSGTGDQSFMTAF